MIEPDPESSTVRVAWPVRTERLTLRAGTTDDVEPTWAYRRLDTVAEWLTRLPTDIDDYRETFVEPRRLGDTVVAEHDGRLIGDFMLRVEDSWAQADVADQAKGAQAELGWVLDPAYTGRGFATEAVRAILDICFEQLGVRRVVAQCFADNVSSWRLMERLGMRRETHAVQDSLHRQHGWLDGLGYGILADEWRSRA